VKCDLSVAIIEQIPSLRRFARSLCRDAEKADDVVQECLLRAIAGLDSFTPGTNLTAWLFTILRNCFLNGMRRQRREQTWNSAGQEESHERALDASQPHVLALTQLWADVDRLPPAMRECLMLVAVEGLSYEDAAAVLQVPVGTVRSRLSRARSTLLRMQEGVAQGEEEPCRATA
jgi:RNA polymerase sigma-70 factor, ECF subfamily